MMTPLEIYRTYCNDYLTVERLAEDLGVSTADALRNIELGRDEHNRIAAQLKRDRQIAQRKLFAMFADATYQLDRLSGESLHAYARTFSALAREALEAYYAAR